MKSYDKIKLPPLPEPDSYLFQHEETGLTEYVCSQQVEWGFEKANPRWQKIHGAFTERQMKAYAIATLESSEVRKLREALEMIAGIRPCLDNLMGNVDIALTALEKLND